MAFLVTGVTGLVGSHILFELLRETQARRDGRSVYVLVRAGHAQAARKRLLQLFSGAMLPRYLRGADPPQWLARIHPVHADLNSRDLRQKLGQLPLPQATVIHAAASTNLLPGKQVEEEIVLNNAMGTENLLGAVDGCRKFVYISTAFSCGIRHDVVGDRYAHDDKARFRNAYEKYKSIVEDRLRRAVARSGRRLQILRPSVVCGRLHDDELFVT
jgi:thioester reductase-like protein